MKGHFNYIVIIKNMYYYSILKVVAIILFLICWSFNLLLDNRASSLQRDGHQNLDHIEELTVLGWLVWCFAGCGGLSSTLCNQEKLITSPAPFWRNLSKWGGNIYSKCRCIWRGSTDLADWLAWAIQPAQSAGNVFLGSK